MFKKPPLPLVGNKSSLSKAIVEQLKKFKNKGIKIIIDLFGGTGIVSRLAASLFPECLVIYNNYGDKFYTQRLKQIPRTNEVLQQIHSIGDKYKLKLHKPIINEDAKREILDTINDDDDILTIGRWLLFSSNAPPTTKDELCKMQLYYNPRMTTIDETDTNDWILDNMKVVHEDWWDLYNRFHAEQSDDVLWIADPPYFNTTNRQYGGYSLDLLDYIKMMALFKSSHVMIFSNNNNMQQLCQAMKDNFNIDDLHIPEMVKLGKKTIGYNVNVFDTVAIVNV